MNHRGRKNSESLCEKSMILVANIIKLSALSVSKLGFDKAESRSSSPANGYIDVETSSTTAAEKASPAASPTVIWETRRSQVYVAKPRSENLSSSLIGQKMRYSDDGNVDGWASKYIEKVHKKNQSDLDEKLKGFLH